MTYEEYRAIVLSLPGVEEGLQYSKPAFKVGGRLLTRWRAEDDSAVLPGVTFDERDMLVEAEPQTFHFLEGYRSVEYVLARLARLDPDQLRGFLLRRWRKIAPRKLVKAYDAP